jgi:hypothetical protein
MASKRVTRWALPLSLGLSLPIGITMGREFGGDSLGLRVLYGGVAGGLAALAIASLIALLSRRSGTDAEQRAALDPARDRSPRNS